MKWSRHRTYATLLAMGAGLLLYRTLEMISADAMSTLVPWVRALLVIELIIDAITVVVCLTWAATGKHEHIRTVIRATTTVIILHAVRVAIFVLGRAGPWVDFDVLPEARAMHATRWSWGEVYFAGTMAVLSVVLLGIFWFYSRRRGP
jgi:hypothetical protein